MRRANMSASVYLPAPLAPARMTACGMRWCRTLSRSRSTVPGLPRNSAKPIRMRLPESPPGVRKRVGWGVFVGNRSYVVDQVGVVGWLPGCFARFCDAPWRLRPFGAGSLPWNSLFWGISSIVRFGGIISGRVGRILLRDFCFVFVGFSGGGGIGGLDRFWL